MSFYGGERETWKVVYYPSGQWNNGNRGVALIEAGDYHHAMNQFMTEYAGQYTTIESCRKLLG